MNKVIKPTPVTSWYRENLDLKQDWFFTFGPRHTLGGAVSLAKRYILVKDKTYLEAREYLFPLIGVCAVQYRATELHEHTRRFGLLPITEHFIQAVGGVKEVRVS